MQERFIGQQLRAEAQRHRQNQQWLGVHAVITVSMRQSGRCRTGVVVGIQHELRLVTAVANGGTGATAAGPTAANNVGALAKAHNLSDLANVPNARTNLGLGSAAIINTPVSIGNGGTGTVFPGGTAGSGLTVSGSFPTQQYSLQTPVSVANGGTGATAAGATAANNIGALALGNNLSDLASASTARLNLGLGSLSTLSTVTSSKVDNSVATTGGSLDPSSPTKILDYVLLESTPSASDTPTTNGSGTIYASLSSERY